MTNNCSIVFRSAYAPKYTVSFGVAVGLVGAVSDSHYYSLVVDSSFGNTEAFPIKFSCVRALYTFYASLVLQIMVTTANSE